MNGYYHSLAQEHERWLVRGRDKSRVKGIVKQQ